jgi:hypothetical protein
VHLNSKPWDRKWFEHGDIIKEGGIIGFALGGIIEFALGGNMTMWETTGDVPPSPGGTWAIKHSVIACAKLSNRLSPVELSRKA